MKNSKKWIALGLSLMMLGGLVACGNEESSTQPSESSAQNQSTSESETQEAVKDPVTLEWWYSGNGIQKDTELVEEEFNKLLQTYPGMEHVTVNFNCIVEADYGSQVSLAQSAEQKMDILQTYNLVFANEVANGTFLPLNNYLDEYPNLKNELPDWLWNFGTVDGNIYIVPNYQRASNQMYLITPKVYMDKYGDYEKLSKVLGDNNKTIEAVAEVIEEYYLAVRDGESGTKYMYPISHYWRTPWGYGLRGDNLGTNRFVLPSDSDEVIYRYTSEEMLKGYEISAEWYAKGYVHPDYLTVDQNDFVETNMLNEVSWIYYCGNGAGSAEVVSAQYSEKCGFEVVAIPNREVRNGRTVI